MASAVGLAVIALGGVILLVTAPDTTAGPSESVTTPSPATATQLANPASSICGLPAGPQAVPGQGPTTTTWELIGSVVAPTSDQFGPGMTEKDGLRRCYAHSPTGAVFAAANFIAHSSQPELRHSMLTTLVVPDTAAERALAAPVTTSEADLGGRSAPQIAGFRVEDPAHMGPDSMLVEILMRLDTAEYRYWATTLQWVDGDWKVQLSPTGNTDIRTTTGTVGFVPWSGLS